MLVEDPIGYFELMEILEIFCEGQTYCLRTGKLKSQINKFICITVNKKLFISEIFFSLSLQILCFSLVESKRSSDKFLMRLLISKFFLFLFFLLIQISMNVYEFIS